MKKITLVLLLFFLALIAFTLFALRAPLQNARIGVGQRDRVNSAVLRADSAAHAPLSGPNPEAPVDTPRINANLTMIDAATGENVNATVNLYQVPQSFDVERDFSPDNEVPTSTPCIGVHTCEIDLPSLNNAVWVVRVTAVGYSDWIVGFNFQLNTSRTMDIPVKLSENSFAADV